MERGRIQLWEMDIDEGIPTLQRIGEFPDLLLDCAVRAFRG